LLHNIVKGVLFKKKSTTGSGFMVVEVYLAEYSANNTTVEVNIKKVDK
jgi:hypothetical protein